jgi:molybdate transport system substrate-binding protein
VERRAFLAALPASLVAARAAAGSEELLVFAAASLSEALEEIGASFERTAGARVAFRFAGSGELARQIRAGAPADVFVSADRARMDALEAAGLVRASDRFDLLSNRLVVVVGLGSAAGPRSAGELAAVPRLALADPDTAPAGAYAREWLESAGLWSVLRERVVPTLDVRATLAAVESGAVEAGVVYRTDAAVSRKVRVAFEVAAGPRVVYPAAALGAPPRPLARAFLEALRSPAARAVFERRGFIVLGAG